MNALKLQAIVARRPTSALRRAAPLWRRNYSSAIPDTLPLAGFKVLDMTRVLAGVSGNLLFSQSMARHADLFCIAILYTNTGRFRVRGLFI